VIDTAVGGHLLGVESAVPGEGGIDPERRSAIGCSGRVDLGQETCFGVAGRVGQRGLCGEHEKHEREREDQALHSSVVPSVHPSGIGSVKGRLRRSIVE
jgi:hypothetical protein